MKRGATLQICTKQQHGVGSKMPEEPRIIVRYDYTRQSVLAQNCVNEQLRVSFCRDCFSARRKVDHLLRRSSNTATAVYLEEIIRSVHRSFVICAHLREGLGVSEVGLAPSDNHSDNLAIFAHSAYCYFPFPSMHDGYRHSYNGTIMTPLNYSLP